MGLEQFSQNQSLMKNTCHFNSLQQRIKNPIGQHFNKAAVTASMSYNAQHTWQRPHMSAVINH